MRTSQRSEKPHCAEDVGESVDSSGKAWRVWAGLESVDLAECEQEPLAPIGAAREGWVRVEGYVVVDGDETKASHALTRHSRSVHPAGQYAASLSTRAPWVEVFVIGFVGAWLQSPIVPSFILTTYASSTAHFHFFASPTFMSFVLDLELLAVHFRCKT